MDFLYRFRQFLSGPPAIVVALVIIFTPITKVIEKLTAKDDETVINLNDPPPPPPPPKEEVKEIKPEPKEVQPIEPVPDVITKDSVVTEIKPPAPEPVKQVENAPPRTETAPVQTGPTSAQIQAGYEVIIRRYLESIKRYPTSREARLQRLVGKVVVWMDITRDGTLKDAGILKSSDSLILDNAALASVRGGKYPPFPAGAYPGEAVQRFNLPMEYSLEPQN